MTRRALVTGVAGGIGSAIAELLTGDGWQVLGLDVVEPSKPRHIDKFSMVDLDDLDGTAASINRLVDGKIDALINNAAVQPGGTVLEATATEWEHALRVNVVAPAILVRTLGHRLQGGSVVNVSSVHATATSPGRIAYATSKTAVIGLTRAMALELAPHTRVNAILAGAVDTPMLRDGLELAGLTVAQLTAGIPLGRIAEPREIAKTVRYLASDESSYMTGQSITVDGGVLAQLASE